METILLIFTVNLFIWGILAACLLPVVVILLVISIFDRINTWEKE